MRRIKMLIRTILFIFTVIFIYHCKCHVQTGPDPWNYNEQQSNRINNDNIPPDLKVQPKKNSNSNLGVGEWFFRRLLSIVLKGGQLKTNEDGSIDASLLLKLDKEQWRTLDGYLASGNALSEAMYRRSLGYIEQAIYEPTITDKIVMAWSDYVQVYLETYKMYITWGLAALGVLSIVIYLWSRMSHTHIIIIIGGLLYLYEVFTSYKEAEKQELETFLSAVNSCKWYFWSSSCTVPKPDPLIFIRHMNPLKIALRMFTTIISEPMIGLSTTVKALVHDITDGIWAPFDTIVYGILLVAFNAFLLVILVTILFNYILNVPINVGFLGISLGLRQRERSLFGETRSYTDFIKNEVRRENADRISGQTFNRMLDVLQQALHTGRDNRVQSDNRHSEHNQNTNTPKQIKYNHNYAIRRSASTGRLPNINDWSSDTDNCNMNIRNIPRKRNVRMDGSGDAR